MHTPPQRCPGFFFYCVRKCANVVGCHIVAYVRMCLFLGALFVIYFFSSEILFFFGS